MRTILVAFMGCMAAFAVVAKDAPKSESAHKHIPLNNVVKMDQAGKRTALCCCGYEFTVTDNAPVFARGGTNFYMCGEGCKEVAAKESQEESEKTYAAWEKKYSAATLWNNLMTRDGKQMAKCGCGAEFTVKETTPVVLENGMKMYCCGDGCHEHFLKMAEAERLQAEQKFLADMGTAAPKK